MVPSYRRYIKSHNKKGIYHIATFTESQYFAMAEIISTFDNTGVLSMFIETLSLALRTLLSCMSRLAPFFNSTRVASTLFTAAAQCRADLPEIMGRMGKLIREGMKK